VIDGRFRVLRQLGAGGMGVVYLAEHVGIGKRVAIKVLRTDLRAERDLVRRFRHEAMAVSKLTDAHTITVFDYGVWKGLVYLVMEYLQGEDLAHLLEREGSLDPQRALFITHQICSSLGEAHAVGIIHRDLKPENVYITQTTSGDELIRVLDFGLAKILDRDGGSNFRTENGALLGTPFFMAPEQIAGQLPDARVDLYALGILLFRMLTGHYPYSGDSPLRVLEGHLSDSIPSFQDVAPELQIPKGYEALVQKLMAREPNKRPVTAMVVDEEVMRLLEQPPSSGGERSLSRFNISRSDLSETVSPLEPELEIATREEYERYERKLRRKSRLNLLLFLLLLVGAGAGAWRWNQQGYQAPSFEAEPNDDPSQALEILPNQAIRGILGRRTKPDRSDRDIYLLRLKRSSLVEFSLGPVPGMDLILEVFDTHSQRLGSFNTTGTGEGEQGSLRSDLSQLLFVVREVWVQGEFPRENSTDPYTLKVSVKR